MGSAGRAPRAGAAGGTERPDHPWLASIPNLLTSLRILAVIPLVLFFYAPWSWAPAACSAVFGFAAVTDCFDGFLARRWNVMSEFGAFLDPLADKLIAGAALVLLPTAAPCAGQGPVLAIPAVVITLREIAVTALREWMAVSGTWSTVKVAWLGKCKTAGLMVSITGLLATCRTGPASATFCASVVLLYCSAVLGVVSGAQYLQAAWPALSGRPRAAKD